MIALSLNSAAYTTQLFYGAIRDASPTASGGPVARWE